MKIITRHREYWSDKTFCVSFAWSLLFAVSAFFANHAASIYATINASNPVKDILLDNIPVMNVGIIVNEGAIIFGLFVFALLLLEPKRIPFTLKSIAIFFLVRSVFLIMTHLGPYPSKAGLDPTDLLYRFNVGGDYFFSGHTGLPFLIALIFWDNRNIRIISIATSILFGASVILGHFHYSIDVFSAFFIAYGVFHITRKIFAWDHNLLVAKNPEV